MFSNLFGGKKRPKEQSPSALRADVLRDTIVAEAESQVPRFESLVNSTPANAPGGTAWTTFGEAVRDVARAAYSYDEPRVRPREEVLPSHLFNREVVQQVLGSQEFQAARIHTSGNAPESLFSAIALGDVLEESAELAYEHIERSKDAREQEEAQQTAQEMLDQLRERAKAHAEAGEEIPQNLVQDIKRETQTREFAKAALAEIAQQHATSNAAAVAQTIAMKAGQHVLDAAEMGSFFSALSPGSAGSNLSPETQVELGQRLVESQKLKEIAKLAGRLIRDMRFKRQARTKNVPVEPVGITTGRDIGRMLPHEAARAFMPALRPTWIKDYSERNLLEYQMAGKDRAGKGPIVFVMDGSGSMSKQNKIIWAQAVGLALLSIAQREKRAFACVQFAGSADIKHWVFPKGKTPDPERVMDMISFFFCGGSTVPAGGLEVAWNVITQEGQFHTADVVLATDGICPFGEDDQKRVNWLREENARIHGIAIMAPNNKYLELACDWYVNVEDMAGSNEATDRIASQLS